MTEPYNDDTPPRMKEIFRRGFRTLNNLWPHYVPKPVVVEAVPDRPKFFAHIPHPRQQQFLDLDCEEVLFGGAAGGGKSDAILMAALQNVDVPGYKALILRRSLTRLALEGAIMNRAQAWLAGTAAVFNEQKKTFTFPSGAKLTFGFIDNVKDRFRYDSSEYHFIGWDELTEFDLRSEEAETNPYLYMFSRLRRTDDLPVVPRVRAATTPGREGHQFVKNYFVKDAIRDENGVYWKTVKIEVCGEMEDSKRAFLPSLLKDNPSLPEREYHRKLARLPRVTRNRYLAGDWDIQEGTLIDVSDFGKYEVEQSNVELLYPLTLGARTEHVDGRLTFRFAIIDTAGSSKQKEAEAKGKPASYSVIMIFDSFQGKLFLREVVRGRFEWPELKSRTIDALKRWRVQRTYIENATVGPPLERELQEVGIPCELIGPVLDDMETGVNAKYERAVAGKLFTTIEGGSFYVPTERSKWLDEFESELGSWTGRINETADQIDTASYGCHVHHVGALVSGGIL